MITYLCTICTTFHWLYFMYIFSVLVQLQIFSNFFGDFNALLHFISNLICVSNLVTKMTHGMLFYPIFPTHLVNLLWPLSCRKVHTTYSLEHQLQWETFSLWFYHLVQHQKVLNLDCLSFTDSESVWHYFKNSFLFILFEKMMVSMCIFAIYSFSDGWLMFLKARLHLCSTQLCMSWYWKIKAHLLYALCKPRKMILILLSLSLDVIGFITFLMIDAIGFATSLMPAYLPKTCKFQMNLGLWPWKDV